MDDRRQDIALFRYSLVREAAEPALSARERGLLVRALAERDHLGPRGERVRVSRTTLDRWIRAYRRGGFQALLPRPRRVEPRTDAALLALALQLKRELPRRTAAQVAAILRESEGVSPSERTLQRHFARAGLNRPPYGPPRAYGRFEAEAPNDLWTGDALHGPPVGGRRCYLFCFIDDHSRCLVGYRFGLAEDTLRLEAALRQGLASRGVPRMLFVDNGSPFASQQLARAAAVLGIRLVHSRAGEAASRGKVERVFGTVRGQFLVELERRELADLAELNRLFAAWVEGVYHQRVHSETKQAPLARFLSAGPPALPSPAELREAFLWAAQRRVSKTATVELHGNRYEVDAALVGRQVELLFDPFELAELEVRYEGRPMGLALPQRIARHVHPKARPETEPVAAPATGIDYLGLVEARHAEKLRRRISYAALPDPPEAKAATPEETEEDPR